MQTKVARVVMPKDEFVSNAKPVTLIFRDADGRETLMAGNVKEFSTGSWGFYANGKPTVQVNGKAVELQLGCNMTVIGSGKK